MTRSRSFFRFPVRSVRVLSLFVATLLAISLVPLMPAQPVSAIAGPVSIQTFVCPDGYDATNLVVGQLTADCVDVAAGESFSLTPSGDLAVNAVADGAGLASWASIVPGTGTISLDAPGDYESAVWCSVQGQGEFGVAVSYSAAGNAISYDVGDGQDMNCSWFKYRQLAALLGSEIRLQKWVCPPGYEAGLAVSLDDLWTNCNTAGAGFPFSRVPDGGDPPVELQADAGGAIEWPQFPAGTGIVTEAAAEMSLSRVFCAEFDIGVIGLANYVEFAAIGNQIAYDLGVGKGISCEWFNYGLPEPSFVNSYKFNCSEGYDWEGADLATLQIDCGIAAEGVSFNLSGGGLDATLQTDIAGFAGWQVDAGDYVLTEVVPAGFGDFRVFCGTYPTAVGPGMINELLPEGTSVGFTLDPGNSIDCYWFNLPSGSGSIVVDKFECPDGYAPGSSFDNLIADCTVPLAGVTFTLTPEGAEAVQVDTDAAGQIVFSDIPVGGGTLAESVPAGYNWVEVYCSVGDGVVSGVYIGQSITAANVLTYDIGAGETWNCSWFNLQVDPGPASLTINVYTCQSQHDPIEPLQALEAECDEPTEDILFALGRVGSVASASTGEGGRPSTIRFAELEPGTYLLTEEIPETIRLAYINECRSDARSMQYPFSPFAIIEPGGRISVELLPGENLECDWYNIQQDTSGTVTIVKYWCDGTSDALTNCQIFADGVGFTLNRSDGAEQLLLETGPDGMATTDAVGTYQLTEEDYEWCSAQSTAVDANGNVVVESGQNVMIEIYNCGPRPLPGT